MANHSVRRLVIAAALVLSGCSGDGGMTTGSLFGSSKAKPVADDRTERALQVAATSARAARCGYNFDPARLRQSYLTYETSQGGTPEQLAKAEKTYDFTRTTLAGKIAKEEDFCSEDKTKVIKAALTRHLAGDFSAPARKPEAEVAGGWFSKSDQVEPMDREKIFDPMARRGSNY